MASVIIGRLSQATLTNSVHAAPYIRCHAFTSGTRFQRSHISDIMTKEYLPIKTGSTGVLLLPSQGSSGSRTAGQDSGSGAKPLAQRNTVRRPAITWTTELSTACRICRSCTRNRSAMPPSRVRTSSSSVTIGSPLRLALVATTEPSKARSNR